MSKFSKYLIFSVFALIFVIPAIQILQIFPEKALDGAYNLQSVPSLTKESWFSGQFQEQFAKSIEDHIGFRSFFVRLKNELDYDLFGINHASNVVVGKNQVLYQDFYLQALHGEDYVGDALIKRKLDKFQFVQNELQKRGVFLMLLIAPGKASIYPEYIPESWNNRSYAKTNYDGYVEQLRNYSINYIDMRQYFQQIKKKVAYPLFPKCGTHWSGYAMTLVADTLFSYIENKTGCKLLSYQSKPGYTTNSDFRFTDNDIGKGMNLLVDIPSWEVYYPEIVFNKPDSSTSRPHVLCIGDSFTQSFWGFYPLFDSVFGNQSQYWYYNRIISWPDSLEKYYIPTEHLDYKKEIEKRNVVLVVSTEQNLKDFGFSFIDEAYNVYDTTLQYEARIKDYINKALYDEKIHEMILKKSIEKGVSFETMAFMDAKWLVNEDGRKKDEEILHQAKP